MSVHCFLNEAIFEVNSMTNSSDSAFIIMRCIIIRSRTEHNMRMHILCTHMSTIKLMRPFTNNVHS